MNCINLDESTFWEWMGLGNCAQRSIGADFQPKSNNDHVNLLSGMMENHWESIALNRHKGESSKCARTLDILSRQIPRRYFLELQFCLSAYSSVFATVFPSMRSGIYLRMNRKSPAIKSEPSKYLTYFGFCSAPSLP